jgi:hypothetical protein
MTYCKRVGCRLTCWKDRLCYEHYRENQGFVFDRERGVFIHRKDRSAVGRRKSRVSTVPVPPAFSLAAVRARRAADRAVKLCRHEGPDSLACCALLILTVLEHEADAA